MNLTVQAVLLDHQGNPASGVEVELCTYDARGRPTPIATARSNTRGNLSFRARLDDVSIQPRLMLRTRIGNRSVELADAPVAFSGARADFGQVSLPAPEQTRSAQALRELMQSRQQARELINRGSFPAMEGVSREDLDPKIRGEIERPLLGRIEALERERDDTITEIKRQKAETEKRIGREVEAAKAPLLDRIAQLERDIEPRESVIEARVKEAVEKIRQDVADEIAKRDEELESLRRTVDLPRSLEGVVLSSQLQLRQASEKIRQSGGGYTLGRVSVTARMIPNEEGTGFRLPTAEDLKDYKGPFNDISYDLAPAHPAREEPASVQVPDLTGLTESLARIRAQQVGLDVQVRGQTVPADSPRSGQVVRQIPAAGAGAELSAGGTITVLIGRPLQPAKGDQE
jgi:hypothetical protein